MSKFPSRTPSQQVARAVLDAALAILDESGHDGFTVRALAQRAGVAPMAIYNHFDGVNGVIEALWIEGFEQFRQALDFRSDDPAQDLFDVACVYREFALAHPGLYAVMFRHLFRHFQPSPEAAHAAALTFQMLVETVEHCQGQGLFPDQPAADAAQALWSACHGYVALELLDMNFSTDRDRTFHLLLTILHEGFGLKDPHRGPEAESLGREEQVGQFVAKVPLAP